jgi:hypothetical protein
MNPLDTLSSVLFDLARAVGEEIPLVVGGGFGLYLKQEQLRDLDEKTLLDELPEPRAQGNQRH